MQRQTRGSGEKRSRAYGDDLAQRFWLEKTRSHVTRTLSRGALAVTQIKSDFPTPQPSQPIGYDEAYLVGLMVGDVPDHELWQDGKAAKTSPFSAGQAAFYDLRRDPISFTRCAHHSLHFYLPRAVLIEMGEQAGRRGADDLHYQFATGYDDPVMRHLGAAVLPALERGGPLDGLFLDHILHAVAAHVTGNYSAVASPVLSPVYGGLTPHQLRRAQELMHAHLSSDISLKRLAEECGLSVTHFSRAFRQSTGMPPYRWLQERRLSKAMSLLADGKLSLSDIATECGFADQSHFTRIFHSHVGVSPGRWRRART